MALYTELAACLMCRDAREPTPSFGESKEFDPTDIRWLLSCTDTPVIFEIGDHQGSETKLFLEQFQEASILRSNPIRKISLYCWRLIFSTMSPSFQKRFQAVQVSQPSVSHQQATQDQSKKKPKNHLSIFSDVYFERSFDAETVRLDDFCSSNKIKRVDFIWADVQGAEEELIDGMGEMTMNINFIYTEFSNEELCEGQIRLENTLNQLPSFRVFRRFCNDILLMVIHPNFSR